MCPCGEDDQTAEHILKDCRNLKREHVVYYRKSPGQAIRAFGYETEDDTFYHFVWCSSVNGQSKRRRRHKEILYAFVSNDKKEKK